MSTLMSSIPIVPQIEQLSEKFVKEPSEQNGFNLVNNLRCGNHHQTNILLGTFISNMYPHNTFIRAEVAISAYYSGNYKLSYDLYTKNLLPNLYEQDELLNKFNRHFSIDKIADNFIYYNKSIVDHLCNKTPNPFPLVTFTVTTCKRFDLFEKTMNSFLNCCLDINRIDRWLCVDDNSTEEDRKKMKELYPFFTFYFKLKEEKGHPRSMNIIRDTVKTEFIFHMEDDWKFFAKRNYITECMSVLGEENTIGQETIGQCLINKNYTETSKDIDVVGGIYKKTKSGLTYYIHEYTPDQESTRLFILKHNSGKSSSYWPHFSFRPSLLKRSVLDKLGPYNEKVSHFEMEYARLYIQNGYISAFLDDLYCIHTGRLTSERNDKTKINAYELNGEAQFSGKEEKLSDIFPDNIQVHVINLDSRPDRMEMFKKNCPSYITNYTRFSAIHGKKLKFTPQLYQIFEKNDYNLRVGLVGAALSHIQLTIQLVDSSFDVFCIFEDDITFVPNFIEKLNVVLKNAKTDWDIIYLGHLLYPQHKTDDWIDKEKTPILIRWDASASLQKSMGGAHGYLLSKIGAKKLLEFINEQSMTNGIDTMQQKAANSLNVYYAYPQLVYANCALPNFHVDSDIQYDFSSLSISQEDQLQIEKDFYGNFFYFDEESYVVKLLSTPFPSEINIVIFYENKSGYVGILEMIKSMPNVKKYYVKDVMIIVINPTEKQLENRYFDRLKKGTKWSIEDCLN